MAGKFNPNDYDGVRVRQVKFEVDHPNGLIMPIQMSDSHMSANYVVMGAVLFKDRALMERDLQILKEVSQIAQSTNSQNAGISMTTIALLLKADAFGHSVSIAGSGQADKTSWIENCETSAIGRALTNAGYGGDKKGPSREEIERAMHNEKELAERQTKGNEAMALYNRLIASGYNHEDVQGVAFNAVGSFSQIYDLVPEQIQTVINSWTNLSNNPSTPLLVNA